MSKEHYFIAGFASRHIGDDAAVVDGWVASVDAFCEGVHFLREWMSPTQAGRKAMLVNISDAVAMNAEPRYALVSAAVPKDLSRKELRDLSCALEKSAAEWGVEIIGGDTVASDRLGLSITILAKSKRPLYRRVRPGMVVGHTGELGRVGRDLRRLLRGGRVSRRSKFFEPKPRKAFMRRCARLLFGAMDISDGLFDDMAKLAEKNRVGYRFLRRVPKRVGCSGEEYEILFAIDPRRLEALRRRARIARTPVTIVAKAVRGRYKNPCKPHHF